jgi:hypothetical protein
LSPTPLPVVSTIYLDDAANEATVLASVRPGRLDRQFRLLREDMIAPIREGVAEAMRAHGTAQELMFDLLHDVTLN